MKKTLLIIFTIIVIAGGAYFLIKYGGDFYTRKMSQLRESQKEKENEAYRKDLIERSVFGKVVSFDNKQIRIISGQGSKEDIFEIDSNTIIQKLDDKKDEKGMYKFVDAKASDLRDNMQVWVIIDKNNSQKATYIKIQELPLSAFE